MVRPPLIALLTDFGTSGGYVAQMKGVILSIARKAHVVDISHQVAPQDIAGAAWLLRDVCPAFPSDTIFVAVVDPGVGSDRALLAARTRQGTFVAPDNGLLTFTLREPGTQDIVSLTNSAYWREPVSATFHGRDIMACVAGHLARGLPLQQLGPPVSSYERLDVPNLRWAEQTALGQIVRIDDFGNLVTNIEMEQVELTTSPERAQVHFRGEQLVGIAHCYSDQPIGQLIALVGSSGLLELAVVRGSAAQRTGAALGEPVMLVGCAKRTSQQ